MRGWLLRWAIGQLHEDVAELRDAVVAESNARVAQVNARFVEVWERLDGLDGEIELLKAALGADS